MTESVRVRTVQSRNGSKKNKKKVIDPLLNIDPKKLRDRGKEILDAMTPAEAKWVTEMSLRVKEEERKHILNFPAVRKAADLTQADVAQRLGIAQAGVSRLESQGDMLLSTLGKYLLAVGENPRLIVTINGEDFEVDLGWMGEDL